MREKSYSMNAQPSICSPASGFGEASFESFLNGRDEPSWLRQRRREAFATFLSSPWPTARDEEWRRTDIRAFKLDAFAPTARPETTAEDFAAIEPVWKTLSANYGAGIAQVNGALVRTADPARLGGAVFIDFGTAVEAQPALLQRALLTQAVTPSADALAALHAAFWTGGTL